MNDKSKGKFKYNTTVVSTGYHFFHTSFFITFAGSVIGGMEIIMTHISKKIRWLALGVVIILINFIVQIATNLSYINATRLNAYDSFLYLVVMAGFFHGITAIIASTLQIVPDCAAIQTTQKSFWGLMKYNLRNSLWGGYPFIAAHLIALVVCILLYSSSGSASQFIDSEFGLFAELRANNPILYIVAFLAHSFIFGLIINFLARCIYSLTKSIKNSIFICVVIYYIHLFIPNLYGTPIQFISDIFYYAPYYVYEILDFDISLQQHILDMLILVVLSTLILFIAYKIKGGSQNDQIKT